MVHVNTSITGKTLLNLDRAYAIIYEGQKGNPNRTLR